MARRRRWWRRIVAGGLAAEIPIQAHFDLDRWYSTGPRMGSFECQTRGKRDD